MLSWNENSVSKDLLVMLATCIITTIALLLIEQGYFGRLLTYVRSLYRRKLSPGHVQDEPLDDDVLKVKERVNAMSIEELREQNLVLQNVSKFYGSFMAVNQVSLDIKQ